MLETDMFYFIVDYSGNYYRENSKGQLVAAESADEATVFTFTEANQRIGGGAKSKFYCTIPITEELQVKYFDEVSVNEQQKKVSAWETVSAGKAAGGEESKLETEGVETAEAAVSAVRELTVAEIPDKVEKSISEYDLSKIDWKEYLTHFICITGGLTNYREELIQAESDVDQKICDVLHYIELCEMDDEEALDLVELLRVCRENRRAIKDEVIRVDSFQKNLGNSANVAKAKEALKAIKGLETRKYKPRKYAELFTGSELKSTKKESRKQSIVEESGYVEYPKEEEINMEMTRHETPFDGKKNDWMEFAMQQAEFYKNAGQYIINLQLDIQEIDEAIDALMQEIETANCNVTQGYKMFKRLKELRLERKEKANELECLYILTEHYDINAMAEECENNLCDLEAMAQENVSEQMTA